MNAFFFFPRIAYYEVMSGPYSMTFFLKLSGSSAEHIIERRRFSFCGPYGIDITPYFPFALATEKAFSFFQHPPSIFD